MAHLFLLAKMLPETLGSLRLRDYYLRRSVDLGSQGPSGPGSQELGRWRHALRTRLYIESGGSRVEAAFSFRDDTLAKFGLEHGLN